MNVRLRFLLIPMAVLAFNTAAAQVNPTVSIDGGSRSIADTDDMSGEAVLLRASASDADGIISDIVWFKGGFPEGMGEQSFFSLDDGPNIIRVVVTDNDGLQAEDTVTITIGEPGEALVEDTVVDIPSDGIPSFDIPPIVAIRPLPKIIEDTDGRNTELIEVTGTAFDLESLSSVYWTVNDGAPQARASGIPNSYQSSFSFQAEPGIYTITLYAEDSAGNISSVERTVEVKGAPEPVVDEEPFVTIITSDLVFEDTDGRNSESIEVIGIARDDNALAGVFWQIDGGASQALKSTSASEYEATFSTRLSPGTYSVKFTAQDRAGNYGFAEEIVQVLSPKESQAIKLPKFVINNASEVEDTNNVNGEFIELEISRDTASQEGASATQFVLITSYPPTQNFSKAASTSEMLDDLQNIVRDAPVGEITLLLNYVSIDPGNNVTLPAIRLLDGESTIHVTLIQTGGLGSTVSKTFNIVPPPERPELSFGYVPSVVADTDEKPGETVNIEVIIESEEIVYLVVYDQFANKLFESEDEKALQVGNLNIPLELLADGHNEILVTARNKAGGTNTIFTGDLKIEVRASEYSELDFDYKLEGRTLTGGTSKAAFYLLVTSTTDGKTSGSSGKIAIEADEGFEVIARIEPQANHVGKEAELFVISKYIDRRGNIYNYVLDEYGWWNIWNGFIENLPKFESLTLEEKNTRTILRYDAGALSGPSSLEFFVAYGLKGQSELYYSGTPIRVDLK